MWLRSIALVRPHYLINGFVLCDCRRAKSFSIILNTVSKLINIQEQQYESGPSLLSGIITSSMGSSCVTVEGPGPLMRCGSVDKDSPGVKMVEGSLWWWVWISGEEKCSEYWTWGTTPWLDPCAVGIDASVNIGSTVKGKEGRNQHPTSRNGRPC